MSRKIVVYKFPDGTTASLPAEEVERRVREQMRDLRQRLVADERKQQIGKARSDGRRKSLVLGTFERQVSEVLAELGEGATDRDVLDHLRSKNLATHTTTTYKVRRARASLLRRVEALSER